MDSCISLKAGRERLNLVRGFEQNGGTMIFGVPPTKVAFISFITYCRRKNARERAKKRQRCRREAAENLLPQAVSRHVLRTSKPYRQLRILMPNFRITFAYSR